MHVTVITVYMLYMYVCVLCVLLPQIELVEEGPPRRLKVEFEYVETKEISSQEFNTVRDTPVILCLLALYVCMINNLSSVSHRMLFKQGTHE